MKLKTKFLTAIVASTFVSTSIISAATINHFVGPQTITNLNGEDNKYDNSQSTDSENGTNQPDNNLPTESEIELSTKLTDKEIINGAPFKELSIIEPPIENGLVNAEDYLYDFLDYYSYEKKVNSQNLRSDVMFYLNSVWKANKKMFGISFVENPYIFVSQDRNTNVILKMKIFNVSSNDQTFVINNNKYNIKSKDFIYINLNITNQPFRIYVNNYNNRYFLGLRFDKVNFSAFNSSNVAINQFIIDNFSFSDTNASYVFLTEIKGVTQKRNYLHVITSDKTYNQYLDNLQEKEIEQMLEKEFLNQQKIISDSMRAAETIFRSLSTNPTLDRFLIESGESVARLLSSIKLIPPSLENLMVELLSNRVSVLNCLINNKEQLIQFALQFVGGDPFVTNVIKNVLNQLKPNMTEEEKQQFYSLLEFLPGDMGFVKRIIEQVFNDINPLDLVAKLLKEEKEEIKKLLNTSQLVNDIIDFISNILSNSRGYPRVLSIFLADKQSIVNLIKSFISTSGSELPDIFWFFFNQIYTDNNNMNEYNVQKLFSETLVPFAQFYNDSTIISHWFEKGVTVSKTNRTISFEYKYQLTFNRTYKWWVTPLKALMPNNIKIPGFPFALPKKWVLDVLFDYITLTDNDKVIYTYKAVNEPIWAKPHQIYDKQYFGFSVPYIFSVWLDWPGGYQSIAGQYRKVAGQWNAASDLTYFLLSQEHTTLKVSSVYDETKVLGNSDYFGEDVYMKNKSFSWKPINDALKNEIWSSLKRDTIKRYAVHTNEAPGLNYADIWSTSLYVDKSKEAQFVSNFVQLSSDIENNRFLRPRIYLNPVIDMRLRYLSSTVIRFFNFEVIVAFPYLAANVTNPNRPVYGDTFTYSFTISR